MAHAQSSSDTIENAARDNHRHRAAALDTVANEVCRRALDDELEIPPLAAVATEVLAIVNDPQAGLNKLAKVIESDPILCGRVLGVANSPLYRAGAAIVSIRQAVSRLGTAFLAQTAVSISVAHAMAPPKAFEALLAREWYESVLRAFVAKELARLQGMNLERAFLAGLMHRVGRPCTYYLLGKYGDRINLRGVASEDLANQLQCALGRLVCERWHLPDFAVACAGAHVDEEPPAAHASLLHTVLLASELQTTFVQDGEAGDYTQLYNSPRALTLGLYADRLDLAWQSLPALSLAAQVMH